MKNKLFYAYLGVFFVGIAISAGLASPVVGASFSKDDEAAMQAIKKHNLQQEKNKMTLQKYQKENPNSMTAQDDDYWSLAWHARLADAGDENSQFIIAKAYENGTDVDTNPHKALAFYQRSCDSGHVDACMRLGEIYIENKWIQKDLDKALYWYVKAAKKGYTPAQFKVASIYEEKEDFDAAYKWAEQAAKTMFPGVSDLSEHTPRLTELKKMAQLQEKMNKRGVTRLRLHESLLEPLSAQKVR